MITRSSITDKLRDPEYRRAFVGSQINVGIPFQIRALLKSRAGWTQATLAEKTGMLQPRISGLMSPGKTRPNIETLRRIAEAFDCGLSVQFVPFTELVRQFETFDPEHFEVPSFDEELEAMATSDDLERKAISNGKLVRLAIPTDDTVPLKSMPPSVPDASGRIPAKSEGSIDGTAGQYSMNW